MGGQITMMKMGIKTFRLFIFISLVAIQGCTSIKTAENRFIQNLQGKCFELKRDSFIHTLNYCLSESDKCFGIQSFSNSDGSQTWLPDNNQELIANVDFWEREFTRMAKIGGRKSQYVGKVEKGTKFKVDQVYFGNRGTIGNTWFVSISIEHPKYVDYEIYLPSRFYLIPPEWVKPLENGNGLVLSNKSVKYCDG